MSAPTSLGATAHTTSSGPRLRIVDELKFGLLVRDGALAESVESTMTSKHGTLYELT